MSWYTSPFWFPTCSTITTPLVYSQDLSIAQQIAHLFGLFSQYDERFDDYVSKPEFQQFLEWLESEQQAQTDEIKHYTDVIAAGLKDLIDDIEASLLQWNVQHGTYTSSVEAMRDMFNDLTIEAWTVEELNESDLTVESLANGGLTVRGLALVSGRFYAGNDYQNNGLITEGSN